MVRFKGGCMGLRKWMRSKSRSSIEHWSDKPLIDYSGLEEFALSNGVNYRRADPFPHIVIDNVLDPQVANRLAEVFPEPEAGPWSKREAKSDTGKDAQVAKYDFSLGRKYTDYEMGLNPLVRNLMLELNSNTFLVFLQKLTGIRPLINDPRMWGGGLHQTLPGGLLRVHTDFLKHPIYNIDRRINVLFFCNKGWEPEWGGGLELWSKDMKDCRKTVDPVSNRMVIFDTTDSSYHGYTKPLACPQGTSRKSIAMYYYTMPDSVGQAPNAVTAWQDLPSEL